MDKSFHSRNPPTILIAEDSPTQAAELSFLLEEQGFKVVQAKNGLKALELARLNPPDLIISDIVMPEMDGYAFCSAAKRTPELDGIPFILVTSLSSPNDVFKGLDVGADNFIVKPYDQGLLVSRINYLLTNRDLRRSGKLQVGIEIELSGNRHFITAERQQILDLLISTYEQAISLYDALDVKQKDLTRSYETLNALYGLAEGLNACETEIQVAASAVEKGLKLPGIDAAWLYLYDGTDFKLAASSGEPKDLFLGEYAEYECACQRKLKSGNLESNAVILECQRLSFRLEDQPLRYHASIPLVINGTAKGVFNLVSCKQDVLSADELRTLSGIGNQIAIALERVQLRESLERKVAERTAELRMILESTPVPTITLDKTGAITTWNRAAETVFGYSAADVVGRKNIVLPDNFATQEPHGKALAEGAVVRGWELLCRHKDGSEVQVRLSGGPLTDQFGDAFGQVLTLEDLRERRRFEEQLRQAQKMEAIGNLTGGIAHDFNNLLTIIIGNVDLALRFIGDKPQGKDLLDGALAACMRGAELTKQLLAFGRRQTLRPEVADANALIRSAVKLLDRTLSEKVKIDVIETKDLWRVEIDPTQLESALLNLSVNARDAMPNGGQITIETSNQIIDAQHSDPEAQFLPGDYVLISVTDTGTGMSREVMSRIFEPFFTTKDVNKGTGLGLAMVYGFVKQSGGHINVYSELGIGTTFKLYLPRAVNSTSTMTGAASPNKALRPKQGSRVLVVEDNDGVRQIVVRQITDMGCEVTIAKSGAEALSMLEQGLSVDLVFSDVVMPGEVSGIELATQVAKRWPAVKILLTSGFPEAVLNRSNPTLRAKILSKPYRVADLDAELSQLLGA